MQNSMFRKGLVVGIIVLFIGMSFGSSTGKIDRTISKTIIYDDCLLDYVNDNSGNPFEAALSDNTQFVYERKHSCISDQVFDLKIKLLMKLGHIPSLSACIIKNNSVKYKGYGYSKILTRQKPTIDTAYLIASITKTVTATALMQLYEQGLFDLDDDVNDFLNFKVRNPNYPDIPITFRMLLAHQSSLGRSNILPRFYLSYCYQKYKDGYPYPMIKEIILSNGSLFVNSIWNNHAPGSESNYSSINFILLEHLVEVLSKKNFTDYCKENIFAPLKMENTSFHLKDYKRNQLAVPYINFGPIYFRLPFTEGLYGMGGLRTSIDDFSHYVIAHMNSGVWNGIRILNESTVEIMHTPQYPNNSNGKPKYGLGWFIWPSFNGITPHGHSGCGYGMTSTMEINSSNDWAVMFFMNKQLQKSNELQKFIYFKILVLLLYKAKDF